MYWLSTSRWCLGPLCMLHFRLNLFLSSLHVISVASVFVWFCCTFWLVFISLVGVYLLGGGPHLPIEPMFFSFLCLWPSWLWILSYHFIMSTIVLPFLFISCYPWAYGLMLLLCQPTSLSIFCSRLPWPISHIFTSFELYWPTFLLCQPISFLGLLQPIYFFFTSFTLMGFLLDPLSFLGSITTPLSLIYFSGLLAFKPSQWIY